ncbi:hypothetical protein [Pseudonocardia sp. GCM10023141]|uniref:hypothetical protein n=1 Tax=Pseudonocardia sp. GCM10023141 TaxID=3252653 RepID=UPI003609D919
MRTVDGVNSVIERGAIERMLAALGGRPAVMAATTQTSVATGSRIGAAGTVEFAAILVEHAEEPSYHLVLSSEGLSRLARLAYTEIGNGTRGHLEGVALAGSDAVDGPVAEWRVAARLRHLDLTSPLRLARMLARPRCAVTATRDAIRLRLWGSSVMTIRLAATGLPDTVRLSEQGEKTAVEVGFADYRRTGKLVLPYAVTIKADGRLVHDERRSAVRVDESATGHRFRVGRRSGTRSPGPCAPAVGATTTALMDRIYSGEVDGCLAGVEAASRRWPVGRGDGQGSDARPLTN